ncbi:hypothetical protein GUITHDRAFT_151288 [Guillardia theta CCMP2712]|uniref:Thioredoxin domain-containing protein n=1 Tax=Guillardia theta (strain CCMP2712) TaxID=905079 RepID=L1JQJ7_GUITC|nr:hypothetical protein GUITHDRAFT_151288 [Guillardia theta CCMP2712]EKX50353.1 hypothetical protein GUITHDRAFT_151288 [Guillardia theta CCMP2712]|eukprot:XP_005837333.1 hypothetical protein GUITHDRAFT_151288 [Guillardia theta CCMP2712]
MDKYFGNATLINAQGKEVAVSSLRSNKVVGLYFSAHWCPPCRSFTPMLAETYRTMKSQGKEFEIVFLSSDQSEAQFKEYYSQMPWLALPFAQRSLKDQIAGQIGVNGIPLLVLVNPEDGKILTKDGRKVILEDRNGQQFPWESARSASGSCIVQ